MTRSSRCDEDGCAPHSSASWGGEWWRAIKLQHASELQAAFLVGLVCLVPLLMVFYVWLVAQYKLTQAKLEAAQRKKEK